jgi:flavin-dependent dehydrogenase
MTEIFDLIVVGGGPAGTSAAITAVREGWRVLLLEKGRFPRHRVCGEFISAESLDLLCWLLDGEHHDLLQRALTMSESRLFLDGRVLRVPVHPTAVSIARYDLDLALWNAAAKAGVTTLAETTVRRVVEGVPFRVATSVGEFRGRAVINSSGRWSNLKAADNSSKPTRWLGLKGHFHGDMESSVDLYFFDGGYCGVQPVRSPGGEIVLNACALVRPDVASTLEEVLVRHPLLAVRSRSWRAAFAPVSTFPAIFREPVPVSGSVFNAGDAAAFVDPFVGDGISLALRGGNLAARNLYAFLRGETALKKSLDGYSLSYRQALRPVYRNSSRLRRFFNVPRGLRIALLSACETSPRLARYLVESTRSKPTEMRENLTRA